MSWVENPNQVVGWILGKTFGAAELPFLSTPIPTNGAIIPSKYHWRV